MFSLVSISIQCQFCLSVSNKLSLLGNLMKVSWSSICENVLNNTQHYPFTSCLIFHLMSFVLSSFFYLALCVLQKYNISILKGGERRKCCSKCKLNSWREIKQEKRGWIRPKYFPLTVKKTQEIEFLLCLCHFLAKLTYQKSSSFHLL